MKAMFLSARSKRSTMTLLAVAAAIVLTASVGIAFAITYQTNSAATNAASPLTLTRPAGTSAGDLLLAQIVFNGGSNSVPTTLTGGWTLVGTQTNNSTNVGQVVYRRVAGSSEPASYAFSWTTSNNYRATGAILRYSGVDTATPVATSSANNGSGTALSATGVTAPAGSTIVAFFGTDNVSTLTTPAAMSQRTYLNQTGGPSAGSYDATASGATGNKTSTASPSTPWVANLVALNPAAVSTVLTVASANQPGAAYVSVASTRVVDAFTLTRSSGTATPSVTAATIVDTGTAPSANISGVRIYRDNGDTTFTAGDTLLNTTAGTFSGATATVTFDVPQSISTTSPQYWVAYTITAGATDGAVASSRVASVTQSGGDTVTNNAVVGKTFTVDKVGPVSSLNTTYTPGTWASAPVTFTLSATDAKSGVKAIHYTLAGATTQADTTAVAGAGPSAPVTVSNNGTTTVTYWGVDNLGNVETPAKSLVIKIDQAGGTGGLIVSFFGAPSGWTNAAQVDFSLDATDTLSGIDQTQVSFDGVSYDATEAANGAATYSMAQAATAEGDSAFWGRAVAISGAIVDAAPTNPVHIQLDRTAPVTSSNITSGTWTTDNTISLEATDPVPPFVNAVSGVNATYYTIDGGVAQTYDPFLKPTVADGQHIVAYWSVDNAGNVEAPVEAALWVDTVAPVTTCGNPDGVWSASAVVTLTASDPGAVALPPTGSGVATTYYVLDGGTQHVFDPLNPPTMADGKHTLTFSSVDNAGNAETPQTVHPWVDTTGPGVAITAPANLALLTGTEVTVTGTASDTVGVASADVRIQRRSDLKYWDGSAWVAADTWVPVTLTATGTADSGWTYDWSFLPTSQDATPTYWIDARATDTVGNKTTSTKVSVAIDNVAPVVAIAAPVKDQVLTGTTSTEVTGTATDSSGNGLQGVWLVIKRDSDGLHWNGSTWGVAATRLPVIGDAPWSYTWAYDPPSQDGTPTYTLSAVAQDTAGNFGYSADVTGVSIDNIFKLEYHAGAHGSIDGSATQVVTYGSDGTSVTATPDAHYHFTTWSDGLPTAERRATNVTADASVTAAFAIDTYTIAPKATGHGTIAPDTTQTVDWNSSLTCTFTPQVGYHVSDLKIDGVSTGTTPDHYTFDNIAANHTIEVFFAINTYTLQYSAGPDGSIDGSATQVVDYGSDGTTVTAIPALHHHFVSWSDGVLTAERRDLNVTADASVTANFAIDTFTLRYHAGTGGSIVGSATQVVDYGSDGTTVTAAPGTGRHFVSWSDGVLTAARRTINATTDTSVTATFALNTYIIVPRAGANGAISPNTTQTVAYGSDSVTFTITPNLNYNVATLTVDGAPVTPARAYRFTNVTHDSTISASFVLIKQTAIGGQTQIDTSVLASQKAFPAGSTPGAVILTTAYNWPDALSGASLGGISKASILLVGNSIAPGSALDLELDRLQGLGAAQVYILGGTVAVPPAVQNTANAKFGAGNVKRLGGTTLYDTSQLILNEDLALLAGQSRPKPTTVLMATGTRFEDALTGSPLSYAQQWPIVLAENDGSGNLTTRAMSELTTVGPSSIHILGGPSVVTSAMADDATGIASNPTVDRWFGVNQYDTAIAVADHSVTGGWLKWDGAAFANGQAFPDALTAAALQGNAGAVLMLTPSVPPAAGLYPGVATKLSQNKSSIFNVTYLGGLAVLPQIVRNQVMAALH